jgi:hypothetical protein
LRVDLEDDCSGRPNPFWTCALGVERGADLVTLRAQVIGADEMLAAALDPFTGRASRIAATQASTSSGIDFAANAQAAADVGLVDVDR